MFWEAYSHIVTMFVAPALTALGIATTVRYFIDRHDRDN